MKSNIQLPEIQQYSSLIGISMIGAPLLMLSADTMAYFENESLFTLQTTLMWLSFFAYIGTIIGIFKLSGKTTTAKIGALIAILGCLIGTTIVGTDRISFAFIQNGIDPELAASIMMEPSVFLTSRAPGIAFPIGLLILTYSLIKAKVLSKVVGGILMIGIILFPVGRIAVGLVANIPGDFIMLLILGGIGINILKSK